MKTVTVEAGFPESIHPQMAESRHTGTGLHRLVFREARHVVDAVLFHALSRRFDFFRTNVSRCVERLNC